MVVAMMLVSVSILLICEFIYLLIDKVYSSACFAYLAVELGVEVLSHCCGVTNFQRELDA